MYIAQVVLLYPTTQIKLCQMPHDMLFFLLRINPLPFFLPGISEWETVLPSFDLSSDGPVRRADADGLEPVPLPYLPLQNLLCLEPALPLLPVSVHGGKWKESYLTPATCTAVQYTALHTV